MIIKKYIIPFLCILSAVVITINAQHIVFYVKDALVLCYNNVIPSLFVFMVISSYLGQGVFTYLTGLPFLWYSRLMKIWDRDFSAAVLLSLTGGFAVGAGFLDRLSQAGYEEKCIMAISPVLINNSLAFCVLAVGVGMLDNIYIGAMLFISLASASLITGFILSFILSYNIVSLNKNNSIEQRSFVDCVNTSVSSVLSICGYVVIFYVLCKVLSLYIRHKTVMNIVSAMVEVTCGCRDIALNTGKNPFRVCAALSILPISTLCQVYHFTHNSNIIKTLILSRFIHTPVSLMIFTVVCNLFPVGAQVLSPDSVSVKYFYNTSEISVVLFMLIICFMFITDQNKLFTKTRK